MNEFTWLAIGAGSPIIAFITFWMALSSKITAATATANEADRKIENLHREVEIMRQDTFLYRERASERFASAALVTAVESGVNKNLLAITVRLDTLQRDLYSRLDTVVGLINKRNGSDKH